MKLLAVGIVLLVGAVAMLVFSDINPAALFVGGGACVFLGYIDVLPPSLSRGAGGPASDTREAIDLTRDIQNHH